MIIAFDYGGTLRVSDGKAELRDLAMFLSEVGVQVHVISAISDRNLTEHMRREIMGLGIPFAGVHFVYYQEPPTEDDERQIGRDKFEVMRKIGASVLIDDNSHVCRIVSGSGLCSLLVKHGSLQP